MAENESLSEERISRILADFGDWIRNAKAAEAVETRETVQRVDLHTLLGQFIALKQEINLQTRASRAQQEQVAEAIDLVGRSMDRLDQGASGGNRSQAEESSGPSLKTLLDVHDALSLAMREAGRVRETLLPMLQKLQKGSIDHALEGQAEKGGFWKSIFGGTKRIEEARKQEGLEEKELALRAEQMLSSLLDGYTMSLHRIDRTLKQQGLEPIQTIGRTFDPEEMEVLEMVREADCQPGEVVDEVRRGYFLNGKVFRYAQVKVSRS